MPLKATSEASVCRMKFLLGSGARNTGYSVIACLNVIKAFSHSSLQTHFAPFLVKSYNGLAM